MTQTVPTPAASSGPPLPVVRVTPELVFPAACRLVSQGNPDVETAARRLVASAPEHGIDLTLAWVTLEPWRGRRPRVRQACLAVLGAGRTAMLFVSEPGPGDDFRDPLRAKAERVAAIDAACAYLGKDLGRRVHIAQGLPEPGETWAVQAFGAADFVKVGDLSYLRREARPLPPKQPVLERVLPPGVRVAPLSGMNGAEGQAALIAALDRTYVDTLDCPELCGLRDTADIAASHRETGEHDPSLWWLVFLDNEAHGCVLMSRCPEQRSAELVYLGLSPRLRGKGLGRALLVHAMNATRERDASLATTLAVDHRNGPARRLYESLGFKAFGERVAFVRRVRARGDGGAA